MQNLKYIASYDELTGVLNRRIFFKKSYAELSKALQEKYPVSFIILDLDHFKNVNDDFGHQAGDEVLKKSAEVCKRDIREGDILGRFGGEELVVFLPNTPIAKATSIAQEICDDIKVLRVRCDNENISVTASLGVSGISNVQNVNVDVLMRFADKALYLSKSNGRNQVNTLPVVF